MIEDKETGLKVAENSEEAFWEKTKESLNKEIEQSKRVIEMDEFLLKLCNEKLKKNKK